jgi:hypothetical protein
MVETVNDHRTKNPVSERRFLPYLVARSDQRPARSFCRRRARSNQFEGFERMSIA